MSSLRTAIVKQFGNPTGVVGRIVGLILTVRPSNRERSQKTLALLDIQPADRVLEIGHGPGLALGWAAALASAGKVVGIDHSLLMHRQAARRNAQAIAQGRVELFAASANAMPDFGAPFDKVLAVNVHLFWNDRLATLVKVARVMRPGATIALTFQPRQPGATEQDAFEGGERIAADLRSAGFQSVRVEILKLRPVNGVCVLGILPE
jgi:ubiquinone/menaquinone biosynthesis C-methylase UbiE